MLTSIVTYSVWLLVISCASQANQVPFEHISHPLDDWNLNSSPDPDDTSHLIFNTVGSLLQQLPNVRYRNGHSIVPGTVPTGTLLYHGGMAEKKMPDGPEWTATDPEHSLLFSNLGYLITLAATRPLKVIYFDGSSGAKMDDGPLDAQDIVAWGKLEPERYFKEEDRIIALCDWGKQHGFDGIVRMEMDFEIMICDFTAGLEIVSFVKVQNRPKPSDVQQSLNTTENSQEIRNRDFSSPEDPSRYSTYDEAPPKQSSIGSRTHESPGAFEVLYSGSRHNRYPGEKRIKLDLSRLITFYDTSLAPSLIPQRRRQERWDHRLQNISESDISAALQRLAEYSHREPSNSGIDWATLIQVVIGRYAEGIELIDYLFTARSKSLIDVVDRVGKVYVQLHTMLHPYLLLLDEESGMTFESQSWPSSMIRLCSTTHTQYILTSSLATSLTESESLILSSVRGTTKEVCRVLIGMYIDIVAAGFGDDYGDGIGSRYETASLQESNAKRLIMKWKVETQKLMSWLDWSVWVYCKPACDFEEICYLPTWPFWNRVAPERLADVKDPKVWWREELWLRPQPRCVRRVEPYST